MLDRFGKIPEPAENLLKLIKLKIKLEPLRIPKLEMRDGTVKLHLPSGDQEFYKEIFPPMMNSLDHVSDIKHRVTQEKSQAKVEITFTSAMAHNDGEKIERLERLIEVMKING